MVQNDPTNGWDYLGFKKLSVSYDLADDIDAPFGASDVDSWQAILDDVKAQLNKDGDFDPNCNCLSDLYVGGHGGPGDFGSNPNGSSPNDIAHFDFPSYDRYKDTDPSKIPNAFKNSVNNIGILHQLSGLMCEGGEITLISCKTCAGEKGETFADEMKEIFGEDGFSGFESNVRWGWNGVTTTPWGKY
jgi:hypothetical protein